MKLYFNPLSPNARKVLTVQNLLNLDVEHQIVDFQKGEHKAPDFLKLNPNGKVPVLVDGEMNLWESNAICAYLAAQQDTKLWPKNNTRYDIMRWMFWEQGHWQPAHNLLVSQHIFAKMRGEEMDQAIVDKGNEEVLRFGAVLNGSLEGKKWLCGDDMTLADIVVASILTYKDVTQAPVGEYKHLIAWFGRIEGLDAWKKSAPPKM